MMFRDADDNLVLSAQMLNNGEGDGRTLLVRGRTRQFAHVRSTLHGCSFLPGYNSTSLLSFSLEGPQA
jgi:hypothetical protein